MTTREDVIHALGESPNTEKSVSSPRSGLGMIGKGSLRGGLVVPPVVRPVVAPPGTGGKFTTLARPSPQDTLTREPMSAPETRRDTPSARAMQVGSVGQEGHLDPPEKSQVCNRHPLAQPVHRNPASAAPHPPNLRSQTGTSQVKTNAANSIALTPPNSHRTMLVATEPDPVEQTCSYSPELIKRLLAGEQRTTLPNASEATEPTRVANLAVGALMATGDAELATDDASSDDVTRVYRALADPEDDTLATQMRGKSVVDLGSPSVIVRDDPPQRNTGSWIKWGLVVMAIGIVSIGWTQRVAVQQAVLALQARVSPGGGAAQPAATRSAGSSYVVISLNVSPPNSRLRLDGSPVSNPCTLQRPADKAKHVLVAEAPGYVALTRTLQFERDTTVMLGLVPAPPPEVMVTHIDRIMPAPKGMGQASAKTVQPTKVRPVTPQPATEPPVNTEPQNDCNPPYSVDEAGVKTYKPECV